jgi:hypothetical protein
MTRTANRFGLAVSLLAWKCFDKIGVVIRSNRALYDSILAGFKENEIRREQEPCISK